MSHRTSFDNNQYHGMSRAPATANLAPSVRNDPDYGGPQYGGGPPQKKRPSKVMMFSIIGGVVAIAAIIGILLATNTIPVRKTDSTSSSVQGQDAAGAGSLSSNPIGAATSSSAAARATTAAAPTSAAAVRTSSSARPTTSAAAPITSADAPVASPTPSPAASPAAPPPPPPAAATTSAATAPPPPPSGALGCKKANGPITDPGSISWANIPGIMPDGCAQYPIGQRPNGCWCTNPGERTSAQQGNAECLSGNCDWDICCPVGQPCQCEVLYAAYGNGCDWLTNPTPNC